MPYLTNFWLKMNEKDPIANFRTPMVTAIGVILGFVLASLGKWATEPFGDDYSPKISDILVMFGYIFGIILLIVAMYRMLNSHYPTENNQAQQYYQRTLTIFISGVSFSFLGFLGAIAQLWIF